MVKIFWMNLLLTGETFRRRGISDDVNKQYKDGCDRYACANVEIIKFN